MHRNDAIAELARPASLARSLARTFDGVRRRSAFVAFRSGGDRSSAFVADDGAGGPGAPRDPMPVGCLAKLLTATLALNLFARRGIASDTRVVDLLDLGAASRAFERVTLRHLLEHTHGLDDSALERAPLRDGFIAADELAARVCAARPLARPGAVYSYGNLGAWLAAAALERCEARRYAVLLAHELLAPLGIPAGSDSNLRADRNVCPSRGIGLSLAAADWLRFLEHAAADPQWRQEGAGGAAAITPLPGWNPLERGIRLGWKSHGHGWFGHQSVWPGAAAFVRMNPARALALVLISRDHAAPVIAARLFGAALPELFDLRMPPSSVSSMGADAQCHVGRYATAMLHAEIMPRGAALELRVHDRARGIRQCAALTPAGGALSFTRPAIESFPYVQLIEAAGAEYLWNGRFVLPRR
jgi:CubicO group peptidase (beta-lactamase class C family)